MAEILDVNTLLASNYEPKRKFRWIFEIDGLDAFTLKTGARPQLTFEETVIDWLNTKRYLAGKQSYSPLNITLNDPIAPSAAQKTMNWVRLCYEVQTGRMGYKSFYAKDFALKMLDPQGAVIEQWDFKGGWVQDANWDELDMASSDITEVKLVIRYDAVFHQY
jgi:hypothetical protein